MRVLAVIGPVLEGDAPEISIRGTPGDGALAYHADFAFAAEPIEALSLHAIEAEDDRRVTLFANAC